jgi:hypothetical protein
VRALSLDVDELRRVSESLIAHVSSVYNSTVVGASGMAAVGVTGSEGASAADAGASRAERFPDYSAEEMSKIRGWVAETSRIPEKKDIEMLLRDPAVTSRRATSIRELRTRLTEEFRAKGMAVAVNNAGESLLTADELKRTREWILLNKKPITKKSELDEVLGLPAGNKKIFKNVEPLIRKWTAEMRESERLSVARRAREVLEAVSAEPTGVAGEGVS